MAVGGKMRGDGDPRDRWQLTTGVSSSLHSAGQRRRAIKGISPSSSPVWKEHSSLVRISHMALPDSKGAWEM